jgi:hypothetical protein
MLNCGGMPICAGHGSLTSMNGVVLKSLSPVNAGVVSLSKLGRAAAAGRNAAAVKYIKHALASDGIVGIEIILFMF